MYALVDKNKNIDNPLTTLTHRKRMFLFYYYLDQFFVQYSHFKCIWLFFTSPFSAFVV